MPKIDSFYKLVVPEMKQAQYRRWFRMNLDTFHQLGDFLEDDDEVRLMGRCPIDFCKCLAMTLMFLGSTLPSFQ